MSASLVGSVREGDCPGGGHGQRAAPGPWLTRLSFLFPRGLRVPRSHEVQTWVSQGSRRSHAAKGATLSGDEKGTGCPRSLRLSGSPTLRRPLLSVLLSAVSHL